jgi:hypothetical protein
MFSRISGFACSRTVPLRPFVLIAIVIAVLVSPVRAASGVELSPAPVLKIDSLGKGTVALKGMWQFHLGDDMAWAQPGADDATGHDGWRQILADKPFAAQGYSSYTGFAWYRRHIDVTSAPGAPSNVVIDIPVIDDAFEAYWNGRLIGRLGSMPPHFQSILLPHRAFLVGPAGSGVLAIRVYKGPLASNDTGDLAGFRSAPIIGSAADIAALKGTWDYNFLRSRQFTFGLVSLYALVSVLCLVGWLRNRDQWLLFWMFVFTLCQPVELFLTAMVLPVSSVWLQFGEQLQIQVREVSQWYLLLWLLDLHEIASLRALLRRLAYVSIFFGLADGTLGFLVDHVTTGQFETADAVLTAFVLPQQAMPAVLVVYAMVRRRKLDLARWFVAIAATVNAMWYAVSNIAVQGVRFTHWTLPALMATPRLEILGSVIQMRVILRVFLFVSFIYAVIQYAFAERRRQTALQLEFQNAREIQRVLVPETLPAIPGFNLTSAYRPAREVGGDFFQILPLENGSTLIVLGDVSGKGLRAAMAVSLIVGAIRTLADITQSPAELLSRLNRHLVGRLQGGFATCIAVRLDGVRGGVLASAGHPAPFLNGHELELPGALPVGLMADAVYEETPVSFEDIRHFALYTDGLLEARRPSGELYGFSRMEDLFNSNPTAAQATEAAVEFGQEDDITVLTLTRQPDTSAVAAQRQDAAMSV